MPDLAELDQKHDAESSATSRIDADSRIDLDELLKDDAHLREVLARLRRRGIVDLDSPVRDVLKVIAATNAVEPHSMLVYNNEHYCLVVAPLPKLPKAPPDKPEL
jgi:hypothetical protein